MLLNEMKKERLTSYEQKSRIDDQQSRIEEQQQTIESLATRLAALES